MHPHVSVLVPVYNVEPYIAELFGQLEHLSGIAPDIELVFVEDGSSDQSLVRLESLLNEAELPNATLIKHGRNRGLSAARNTLIDTAIGTYVWFLDSDDLISGVHAAALFENLRHVPTDCVLFDFLEFETETSPRSLKEACGPEPAASDTIRVTRHVSRSLPPDETLTDREEFLVPYLLDGLHYAWGMIVRRSLLADIRFPDRMIFEDQAVSPRLMLAAKSVRYHPRAAVFYRARTDTLMQMRTFKAALDVGQAMFHSLPSFEEKGASLTEEERAAFGVCLLRSISWQAGRFARLNEMSNAEAQDSLRSLVSRFRRFIGDQEREAFRLMPNNSKAVLGKTLSYSSLYLAFQGGEGICRWQSKFGRAKRSLRKMPARARGAVLRFAPKTKPVLKRLLPALFFRNVEAA